MLNTIPGVQINSCLASITELPLERLEEVPPGVLVAVGQPLLALTKEEQPSEIVLEAGENTELINDGGEILSCCHGYPKISVKKTKNNFILCVSLVPLVEVSKDGMEARLNLFPALPGEDGPTIELILQVLTQQEVVAGIDHSALEAVLDEFVKDSQPQLNHLIARGKAPNDGMDAYIRFEVEIGPLPGKLLADGSIDFRERLMFVGVKKDQLLACKVAATQGRPGLNLAGETIQAKDGSDITVKVSEDAHYCEEDGTIRATASGVLSVIGDDTIRVSAKQKISGDIDFNTGNIRSSNSLEISGSVSPGFLISAKGNVSIGGNIESAIVNTHGNIVIRGGIIGSKSKIRVQGDADIHHIENGLVMAGGNIVIRTGAYYSYIQASGDIRCPENVKIVGGDVVASGSLSCGQLGSPTADPMNIAVGTDPHRYRRYQALQREYQEVLHQTQDWYNRFGRGRKAPSAVLELEKRLRGIEQELSGLNLIPDTPEDSLGNRLFSYTEASITVHSCITAGNVLRIGNEVMVLEHDLDSCVIKMSKASGEITVNPF